MQFSAQCQILTPIAGIRRWCKASASQWSLPGPQWHERRPVHETWWPLKLRGEGRFVEVERFHPFVPVLAFQAKILEDYSSGRFEVQMSLDICQSSHSCFRFSKVYSANNLTRSLGRNAKDCYCRNFAESWSIYGFDKASNPKNDLYQPDHNDA
jgi:hypothetical protein